MKRISTNILKLFGFYLMINIFLSITQCDAAPLPQKLVGPRLQRYDCLINETDAEEPFAPYIQEFLFTDEHAGISLYSCVNWCDGFLKSEGIGKKQSRRAAELVARNNALKTLIVLNLNSTSTLQHYFDHQKQVRIKIENVLIKNASIQDIPVDPQKPDEVKVMVTIPFYGIFGLVSFFLDDQEIYLNPLRGTSKNTTEVVTTSQKAEAYTGIVIDASELPTLEPALFPQIISEQGEVLYSASQVDRDILTDEGMVEYITRKDQKTANRAGEHPLVVKPVFIASNVPFIPSSPSSQFLAQLKSRKSGGKGNNLVVTATNSSGQIPVNVVVSIEDAKKIKQLNEQQQLDQQGKYTILIGGEIGGVKGQHLDSIFVMRNP